jgi:uncharacterized protein
MPSKPEYAILAVRVMPRSSQNKIAFDENGALKVWITAPPVDGEANRAVCDMIAKRLSIAKSRVAVESGESARDKKIRIDSMSSAEALKILGA